MVCLNSSLDGDRAMDSPSKQPASFACVVCHDRKVKCDKQDACSPCSNCAKANVECIYRAPPPPRRKRDRGTIESMSQGRGKYLRRNTEFERNPSFTQNHHDSAEGKQQIEAGKSGSGRMITKDGNSIYLDTWVALRCIWPNVKVEVLTCTSAIFGPVLVMRLVFSDCRVLSMLTIFASSQMQRTY